ncbi:MAG: cupin domain-containing protein [Rikenellaceae bacterium]
MRVKKYDTEFETIAEGVKRHFIYGDKIMSVVVEFSGGPKSVPDPYHSHPHEQTCYIAEGEVLFFAKGDETLHLKSGDMVYIEPNQPHTIQLLTENARLIDNFTPVREDFLK